MTARFRWKLAGSLLVAGVMLISCSTELPPTTVPEPAKPAVGRAAGEATKVEVPSPFLTAKDEYFYNPVGKRDPFKGFAGELVKEDMAAPRAPLERYELDELHLTGIVWGISDPRARIRAPDGYSYIVKMNSRVGKNRGRVSRITRREVFIEEEYRDPTGKLVVRESNFEIHGKEEKAKEKPGLTVRMSDE
ncbi:MAG: pilus assembly protein PilP [Pseudomonadota bacterium]